MARYVVFATGDRFELISDFIVESTIDNVILYVDSRKSEMVNLVASATKNGALDHIEVFKDSKKECEFIGYTELQAVSTTNNAYILTLCRKSDRATIDLLSKRINEMKDHSNDITDLQMAIADIYETMNA